MFWKFLRESFWRPGSRHHALWAVLAVALGTAIAAAVLSVSLDIGDKVGAELRALGANIVITPVADSLPVEMGGIDYRPISEGAYIEESSLPKLKEIFWRNNIVAFAPFLYVPVQVLSTKEGRRPQDVIASTTLVGTWFNHAFATSNGERFSTGIHSLNPTWAVDGEWINEAGAPRATWCLVGKSLAAAAGLKPGMAVTLRTEADNASACEVKGILSTGGAEDSQIFTILAWAQSLAGFAGKVRKVQASALIKPEDARSRRDPKTLTPAEYERWYCSPYLSSILLQIGEVLPGTTARQIQPVAETQGKVMGKLTFLMAMLAVMALVAASLSISSIASLKVLKRRQEISLMKAIGAQDRLLAMLFLGEAALQGLVGGALGFVGGLFLARILERLVFGSSLIVNWMLLPLILLAGLAVSFLGTWGPLKLAMNYEPATVLRGE
jgi:putative ABC transport system permease protein